uniref:Cytokinin-binding protein n=1 Tax=Populus tomentosa TaxID=118781 RepID=L0ASR6_POPTO|nr:cytokinin-binding protein [Populus tomentosa]
MDTLKSQCADMSAKCEGSQKGRDRKMFNEIAAVVKVQQMYRGYRTRRRMADSAVVAQELWLVHQKLSFCCFSDIICDVLELGLNFTGHYLTFVVCIDFNQIKVASNIPCWLEGKYGFLLQKLEIRECCFKVETCWISCFYGGQGPKQKRRIREIVFRTLDCSYCSKASLRGILVYVFQEMVRDKLQSAIFLLVGCRRWQRGGSGRMSYVKASRKRHKVSRTYGKRTIGMHHHGREVFSQTVQKSCCYKGKVDICFEPRLETVCWTEKEGQVPSFEFPGRRCYYSCWNGDHREWKSLGMSKSENHLNLKSCVKAFGIKNLLIIDNLIIKILKSCQSIHRKYRFLEEFYNIFSNKKSSQTYNVAPMEYGYWIFYTLCTGLFKKYLSLYQCPYKILASIFFLLYRILDYWCDESCPNLIMWVDLCLRCSKIYTCLMTRVNSLVGFKNYDTKFDNLTLQKTSLVFMDFWLYCRHGLKTFISEALETCYYIYISFTAYWIIGVMRVDPIELCGLTRDLGDPRSKLDPCPGSILELGLRTMVQSLIAWPCRKPLYFSWIFGSVVGMVEKLLSVCARVYFRVILLYKIFEEFYLKDFCEIIFLFWEILLTNSWDVFFIDFNSAVHFSNEWTLPTNTRKICKLSIIFQGQWSESLCSPGKPGYCIFQRQRLCSQTEWKWERLDDGSCQDLHRASSYDENSPRREGFLTTRSLEGNQGLKRKDIVGGTYGNYIRSLQVVNRSWPENWLYCRLSSLSASTGPGVCKLIFKNSTRFNA